MFRTKIDPNSKEGRAIAARKHGENATRERPSDTASGPIMSSNVYPPGTNGYTNDQNSPTDRLLTEAQARYLIGRIRGHLNDALRALKEFHDLRGWKAIGYQTYAECAAQEFALQRGRAYQLLHAALVQGELEAAGLPTDGLTERQSRAIAQIPKEARAKIVQDNPVATTTAADYSRFAQTHRTPRTEATASLLPTPRPTPTPTDVIPPVIAHAPLTDGHKCPDCGAWHRLPG